MAEARGVSRSNLVEQLKLSVERLRRPRADDEWLVAMIPTIVAERASQRDPSSQRARDAVSTRVFEGRVVTGRVTRQSRQRLLKCRSDARGQGRRQPASAARGPLLARRRAG